MNQPNHSDISKAALSLYLRYEKVGKTFDKLRDYLGVSSASEDDVTFSSKFQRPFNWHFYNNHGWISDNLLVPGQRTSERRFATLLEKLDKYVEKCSAKPDRHHVEDLVETTGRIMHHIQDMSTPSHVVPVYHGPGLKDCFETFIEAYAEQIHPVLVTGGGEGTDQSRTTVTISESEIASAIQEFGAETDSQLLMNFYNDSARATLKFLRENSITLYRDGIRTDMPLSSFWQEKNGASEPSEESLWLRAFSKDFGSFGVLGNNFGNSAFMAGDSFYEGNLDDYLSVYKKLLKKAIIDSAIVLDFVARKSHVFTDTAFATEMLSWH